MLPVIPQSVNALLTNPQGQSSTFPFPLNVAGVMPKPLRKKIMDWMLKTYIWPQVMERRPYESTWDKLLDMARATWKITELDIDENTRQAQIRQKNVLDRRIDGVPGREPSDSGVGRVVDVADTVIFDAVDRLTNLNHFIAFKEQFPVRYEPPSELALPNENDVYSPMSMLVNSANAWLKFNATNQDVYRKGWMTARHHYTYGVSFVNSEYTQRSEAVPRRQLDGSWKPNQELTKIGITFEPISIRKLWLNYRLPVYEMDYQPCPFFFEQLPRFAIIANPYDQQTNPMGFLNLDNLGKGDWLFSGPETESMAIAYRTVYPDAELSFQQLIDPIYSTELKWTLYPVLPLAIQQDPQSGKHIFMWDQGELWVEGQDTEVKPDSSQDDQDQSTPPSASQPAPVPLKRYIMETFGTNLINGFQEIIRLQENFYPNGSIPLYGSAHMPNLDDGVYSPAIGTILEGHYRQICKALDQILINKDLNNDPPTDIQQSSPSMSRKNLNKPGSRNPVNGPNDITRRPPFDSNGTTIQFWQATREQAQTSSKSTDAILGKAMGSRTSATEASNAYQTAMSGVTTDTNLFSHDIFGNYAERVWLFTGRWVDPDILRLITGTYGFAILPEHLEIRFGLSWDCGSQFIESITRQNNIQYLLQACPPGDTTLNRAYLFEELLTEWKFKNIKRIVNDGGQDEQIMLANDQAIETYMGQFVMVDPTQDHQIALKTKVSYLKDRRSIWNTTPEYVVNGPRLVQQIQQHQLFIAIQQMLQRLMMQQQMIAQDPSVLQPLQKPGTTPSTPGQARQQRGN